MYALAINHPPEQGQAGPVQAAPALTSYRQRAAELTIKIYEDRYHFHPPEHPLVQYLHSLPILQHHRQREHQREHRQGQIRLYLTQNWGEVNALALPNQSIIISDRVFSFCHYREELEFLLQHELTHLQEQQEKERMEGRSHGLGKSRFAEYQADLENMLREKGQALNPAGGIVFLQRLADQEKQQQERNKQTYDLAHGDTFVRLMNMEYALRIVDLDALTADLVPIPEELRQLPAPITLTPWDYFEGHWAGVTAYHFHRTLREELLPATQQLSFIGVLENIFKLYGPTNLDPALQREVQEIFSWKIGEEIKAYVFGNESVLSAISSFLVGTQTERIPLTSILPVISQPLCFSYFIHSLQNLPTDQPLQFRQLPKVRAMLQKIKESYSLEEACSKAEILVDTVKGLYSTYSTFGGKESWRDADTALALLNLKRFPVQKSPSLELPPEQQQEQGISPYLHWLEKQNFALEAEEVLLALRDHFSLSRQQVEDLSKGTLFHQERTGGKDSEKVIITPGAREKVAQVNGLVERFYQRKESGRSIKPELLWREVFEIINPASLNELSYFLWQAEKIRREWRFGD